MSVILTTLGCGRHPSDAQNNRAGDSTPTPAAQNLDDMKNFTPEDLLIEIRARELEAGFKLPDNILERRNDEKFHQPALKEPKRNPLLAAYPTETLIQALMYKQQTVYGVDDRKEIFDVPQPQFRKSADAVVSLFAMDRVDPLPGGLSSEIEDTHFGKDYMLCSKEPFRNQPCTAFCSGVLVAPDIVATAGHCVETPEKETPPVTEIKFVFGYRMLDKDNAQRIINNSEIYVGKEVVARIYTPTGQDWALVRLDRNVVGHDPVPVRRSSKVADKEDLYVIGYPCGLPAKFAGGAIVRDNSNPEFFVSNLDTYAGNSGSPVFNRKTHEVEGILVRGEKDFVRQKPQIEPNCWISLVCPTTDCRGQDCVRTTLFAHFIP
jgi:Trypsin-like peptidase domain